MNCIIVCNIRLVIGSVKITQIKVELNIVLACCWNNLTFPMPRWDGGDDKLFHACFQTNLSGFEKNKKNNSRGLKNTWFINDRKASLLLLFIH